MAFSVFIIIEVRSFPSSQNPQYFLMQFDFSSVIIVGSNTSHKNIRNGNFCVAGIPQ